MCLSGKAVALIGFETIDDDLGDFRSSESLYHSYPAAESGASSQILPQLG